MKSLPSRPEIATSLASVRQKRGMSAVALATAVGVSRQTIYAIEAGTYVPNTAVGLKLARALDVTVEELFALPSDAPAPAPRPLAIELLPESGGVRQGQPVQLCQVDKRLIASAPSPVPWLLPDSDAVLCSNTKAQVYDADAGFHNRVLIAGCDPSISVLARHMRAAGVELVLAHRNSSQSLQLLKDGAVHVAGTHLRDEETGESNLPQIARAFSKGSVALFTYGIWEEGIVTAAGNPKSIRGIEDLARKDVRIVNRETGAGSRMLLDARLKTLRIPPNSVNGYSDLAQGHIAATFQVSAGHCDACIATSSAARLFGLGFIPLVSERYDLAIRRRHLELPAVQTLLDTLNRSGFRRDLEGIGGYDAKSSGVRML